MKPANWWTLATIAFFSFDHPIAGCLCIAFTLLHLFADSTTKEDED